MSLVCTGSLELDDESYAKKDEIRKKLLDLLFLLRSQIKLDMLDLGHPEEKKAERGEFWRAQASLQILTKPQLRRSRIVIVRLKRVDNSYVMS